MRTLSVVIPAYNEERYIGTLIERIRSVDLAPTGFHAELVVVDDGSRDRTAELAASFPGVRLVRQENGGKGSAVRRGILSATGDYVLIQDADLEYDPGDYLPILEAVTAGRATVVYGSRYLPLEAAGRRGGLLGGRHSNQSFAAYAGGRSLSLAAWLFTGRYLSDTVTALKLFPRALLLELELSSPGFELDHEITAKVLARGIRIVEVPIRYYPRSRAEGKKIGMRDWFRAIGTFYRFGGTTRKITTSP